MAVLLCILLVPLCLILLVWYWCQRRSLKSAAKQLRELELTTPLIPALGRQRQADF